MPQGLRLPYDGQPEGPPLGAAGEQQVPDIQLNPPREGKRPALQLPCRSCTACMPQGLRLLHEGQPEGAAEQQVVGPILDIQLSDGPK